MAKKEMQGTSLRRKAGRAAFTITLCLLAMGFMSCGTLKGNGKARPVNFTSAQPGVEFEVYNGAGKLVFSGTTPMPYSLKAGKMGVSERYYVKSGGRIEVFQGDFSVSALTGNVILIPAFLLGAFGLGGVDQATNSWHTLPDTQEIGSIYLNTPARLIGQIRGNGGNE